jgi:hypothetical protein
MSQELLCFNGIDADTGRYLLQLPPADLARIASGEPLDPASLAELKQRLAQEREAHFEVIGPYRARSRFRPPGDHKGQTRRAQTEFDLAAAGRGGSRTRSYPVGGGGRVSGAGGGREDGAGGVTPSLPPPGAVAAPMILPRSNRMEQFADALAAQLAQPRRCIMAPDLLIAPSDGMGQWGSVAVAARLGMAAHLDVQWPRESARSSILMSRDAASIQ